MMDDDSHDFENTGGSIASKRIYEMNDLFALVEQDPDLCSCCYCYSYP
jgi:hypothetical protein